MAYVLTMENLCIKFVDCFSNFSFISKLRFNSIFVQHFEEKCFTEHGRYYVVLILFCIGVLSDIPLHTH